MTTTYRHPGETFSEAAPAALTTSTPVVLEDGFGIPTATFASGAEAALYVEGVHKLSKDGNAATMFQIAYWDDANSRVTAVKSGAGLRPVGIFAADAAAGDSSADVKVLPAVSAGPFKIGLQGAGTQLNSGDNAENNHADTITVPTEWLNAGTRIEIRALVKVDGSNGTNTLNCKLKWDALNLIASAPLDVADADLVVLRASVNIQTAGASGEFHAEGVAGFSTGPTGFVGGLVDQSDDLTADVTLAVSGTWSASSGSNATTLKEFAAYIWP